MAKSRDAVWWQLGAVGAQSLGDTHWSAMMSVWVFARGDVSVWG